MATIPSESIDAVWKRTMSELSSVREPIPITKNQFRQLLVLIDAELETAEGEIVSALPSGSGKTWLANNQTLGRGIMLSVLRERKEVLNG